MKSSMATTACLLAATVAAVVLSASQARATVITSGCAGTSSCTLGELFAGGTITVDDKLFADWQLENLDPFGVQPDFDLIVAIGRDDGGLDPGPGLTFDGGGELAVFDADFLDLSFVFSVTVLDPALSVVDNSLELVGWDVRGEGLLTIDESVFRSDLGILGTKHVEVDAFFGTEILFDAITFPPQTGLFIEKDIYLEGFAAGDFVELDRFEQRFSQIPEPGTIGLLVFGLAALAYGRRRL